MSMLGKMLGLGRCDSYDRGLRLFDQGRYEEAVGALEAARAPGPGRRDEVTDRLAAFYIAESNANLGHAAMKRGLWEEAARRFGAAVKVHPHYADLHFNLALACRALGRGDDALDGLAKALEINPRFAKARLYCGLVRYEQGERAEGLAAVEEACRLEPGFRTEALERALACHAAGDFAAALRAFETVSHTEVDDILFHYKLGDDLFRRGLYEEAAGEYRKALAINPGYADVRNHLGNALRASGRVREAVAEFQRALAINPNFVEARLNLGITLRDMGAPDAARSEFLRVLDSDSENPVALDNLHAVDGPPAASLVQLRAA